MDRQHLNLPAPQVSLLHAVAAANPRVVVVLSAGSVVDLSWSHLAPGILHSYLSGQAGVEGVVDVLTGAANPSGKLAETSSHALSDTPTHDRFPADTRHAMYREGPFVGYRFYEAAGRPVKHPFGFGLSYTTFGYSGLELDADGARFTLTNTGPVAGAQPAGPARDRPAEPTVGLGWQICRYRRRWICHPSSSLVWTGRSVGNYADRSSTRIPKAHRAELTPPRPASPCEQGGNLARREAGFEQRAVPAVPESPAVVLHRVGIVAEPVPRGLRVVTQAVELDDQAVLAVLPIGSASFSPHLSFRDGQAVRQQHSRVEPPLQGTLDPTTCLAAELPDHLAVAHAPTPFKLPENALRRRLALGQRASDSGDRLVLR